MRTLRELRAHCYRMSGSLVDAEDLLQECLIRAWRGLPTFEQRSSLRTWLYKVATNVCLNALEARKARTLPTQIGTPVEKLDAAPTTPLDPTWLEPWPDELTPTPPASPEARVGERESVSLAFLVALQLLPPRQRAVLILRDVLGFEASECAVLEMSAPAVKSALQRARKTLDASAAAHEKITVDPESASTRSLLARYVEAWESADVGKLVSLLREDATFSMPPRREWFVGRGPIGRLVHEQIFTSKGRGGVRLLETRANGAAAFAVYFREREDEPFAARSVQVLEIRDGAVASIVNFLGARTVTRFGLPERL